MSAYHNNRRLKEQLVSRLEAYRKAGSFDQQWYGHWDRAKGKFVGCAVGCSLRILDEIDHRPLKEDYRDHGALALRMGIPLILVQLQDAIFGQMRYSEATRWPTTFAQAITVGTDLKLVWPTFARWLLAETLAALAKSDQTRAAVHAVSELFDRQLSGEQVPPADWSRLRKQACDAAVGAVDLVDEAVALAAANATAEPSDVLGSSEDAVYLMGSVHLQQVAVITAALDAIHPGRPNNGDDWNCDKHTVWTRSTMTIAEGLLQAITRASARARTNKGKVQATVQQAATVRGTAKTRSATSKQARRRRDVAAPAD